MVGIENTCIHLLNSLSPHKESTISGITPFSGPLIVTMLSEGMDDFTLGVKIHPLHNFTIYLSFPYPCNRQSSKRPG